MIGCILLAVALIFMAAFDAEHTKRRILKYGLSVELNPFITFLCKVIGVSWGVNLGIRIPTYFWAVCGWYYPTALAFVVGTRFTLFLIQWRTRFDE